MSFLFSRKGWLVWLLIISLFMAACGPAANNPGDEGETAVAESSETEAETAVEADSSQEEAPATESEGEDTAAPASELEYIEVEAGTGPAPVPGDLVSVHYTGTLEDGTVFDSSVERGEPIQFTLGQGEVIPGWDQGIAMMREGGKATLIIPPHLAYGPGGSGTIPPNATLTFEVELVEVQQPPKPQEVSEADFTETESGLKYYFIEEGDGTAVQDGDMVDIHAQLWLEDGTLLQSSVQQGTPINFIQGSGSSLPGLDEALLLMQVGDIVQLVLPPELAGGFAGDTNIIFEMELLNTQQPPIPTEVDAADFTTTESGLKYYALTEGDGPAPQTGDNVTVHYRLWLEDGTLIDSSVERDQPFSFVVGSGSTVPGWEEGVLLMKQGGKAQLVVPPELGYGEAGGGPIPPNSTLIFEVEILEVMPGQ
jgi:peptidylprolyl isomerase